MKTDLWLTIKKEEFDISGNASGGEGGEAPGSGQVLSMPLKEEADELHSNQDFSSKIEPMDFKMPSQENTTLHTLLDEPIANKHSPKCQLTQKQKSYQCTICSFKCVEPSFSKKKPSCSSDTHGQCNIHPAVMWYLKSNKIIFCVMAPNRVLLYAPMYHSTLYHYTLGEHGSVFHR